MNFDRRSVIRVIAKALVAMVAINVLFALANPLPALGRISLYNSVFPGRARLPFGEDASRAYNLSLYDLNAMFASHELAGKPKQADEFRVLLIGDSSTWGFLLQPQDTLAGLLNDMNLKTEDGRTVRAYNLGYPIMSLTKDVLILSRAMHYDPDLIVWLVTLESFPASRQLSHPIVQNNSLAVRELITNYQLRSDPHDPSFVSPSFLDRTLVGQRRAIADWLRLQTYGAMWGATGIDQVYPKDYEPALRDLEADEGFHGLQSPALREEDLAFDVLRAGIRIADDSNVPMLIVNEPILISEGKNSDIRYNFFYPRWAYDQYRELLHDYLREDGIRYLDVWDAVPQEEFTNSAVHLTPKGSRVLADAMAQEIARR